jgi:hypothetical protein
MLDNLNIITGKELGDLLYRLCPADAYPDGITESEDRMTTLVDGKPLDDAAEYRVTRMTRHQKRFPCEVRTIDSDWQVERLSADEAEDRRKARIVHAHAGEPLAKIVEWIAGWEGWYPIVDEDGNLTGEVIGVLDCDGYEATECGNAVRLIEVAQ